MGIIACIRRAQVMGENLLHLHDKENDIARGADAVGMMCCVCHEAYIVHVHTTDMKIEYTFH